MAAPRIVLTPALQVQIVASIRAGGFGHVAAQAWGVAKSVYESWLARGQGRRAREPYRSFAREVAAAQYQARLRAETRTFEEDSKFWLEHGPGRALRNEPGWGSASKPPPETPENKESLLASPEFRTFGRDVREVFRIHQPELVELLPKVDAWAEERNGKARDVAPQTPTAVADAGADLGAGSPGCVPSPAANPPAAAPPTNPTPSANGTPPPSAA